MPTTTEIDVPTPDGVADALLSRPDSGDGPKVLFLMDAFGLRPCIREMTERIAAAGYVVLAPNLFYRAGRAPVLPFPDLADPGAGARFMEAVGSLIKQLDPAAVALDGAAYLDAIGDGPVAITGYCMGARVGWRIATGNPERVVALAGFHGGRLVTDA